MVCTALHHAQRAVCRCPTARMASPAIPWRAERRKSRVEPVEARGRRRSDYSAASGRSPLSVARISLAAVGMCVPGP